MHTIPHIIKYMGSKRNILDFVHDTLFEVRKPEQRLYDLFGGSAVVAGSLRNDMPVTCNDIQMYTSVIAGLYLNKYNWDSYPEDILNLIIKKAQEKIEQIFNECALEEMSYENVTQFDELRKIETKEKKLIDVNFSSNDHLFVKYYSGTYWSFEQCAWIDALSSVARSEEYRNSFLYNVILGALMFAMAYCSQSTGHYAQYRDSTESNTADLLLYRKKSILKLFKQKFEDLRVFYDDENNTHFLHEVTTKDYLTSIKSSIPNSIIYADPPYQFVHYSRFYHALETLVRYDYPQIRHKGRYREDRHQSPFCIKTKVPRSFESMFRVAYEKRSDLVLSYSDNGMISLDDLLSIANRIFKDNYLISKRELAYNHSTMGRQGDKSRSVNEVLLIMQNVA